MCGVTDESLVRFCWAGGEGTRGCLTPPWRRRRGASTSPRSLGVGSCLRAKALIRCRIGTMAASSTSSLWREHCVWRHGSEVLRCAPPALATVHDRSSATQCTVVASDSKTIPFSSLIGPAILLPSPLGIKGGWCIGKGCSVGVAVLRRWLASTETRRGFSVLGKFLCVVVVLS